MNTNNIEHRVRALEGRGTPSGGGNVWNSFGEFLQAVHRSADPKSGKPVDPRLETRAASGLGTVVPSDGGFLMPSQYSPAIMELIGYESVIASKCLRVPLAKSNKVSFPGIDEQSRAGGSRWGGISSTWGQEGDALTASKAKFRSVNLTLKKITAGVYATDELLEDSGVLGKFMATVLPAEMAFRADEAVLKGSGTDDPLGVLNSAALIAVDKEVGQAAATVLPQNIQKMFGRMLPECRRNAVWYVSPEVEELLYTLPLAVGTGGAATQLFSEADEAAPFGRLMNRPVMPIEQAATTGTLGDIVFADFGRYVLAEKPVDVAVSMHVRFIWDESIFRCTYRIDGGSAIHKPLTSYNGGPTRSAFVTLAARP